VPKYKAYQTYLMDAFTAFLTTCGCIYLFPQGLQSSRASLTCC
jgi:hypothetical protein